MNTHYESKRKQEFTNRTNQQILVYENLLNALDMVKPYIQQFDGKVPNARLTSAISNAENPNKITISFGRKPGFEGGAIKLTDYNHRMYPSLQGTTWNYLDYNECYITLVCTDPQEYNAQPRLMASETLAELEITRKDLSERIESCRKDLNDYESELQTWITIEKMVADYEDKYSYRLRGRIDMNR